MTITLDLHTVLPIVSLVGSLVFYLSARRDAADIADLESRLRHLRKLVDDEDVRHAQESRVLAVAPVPYRIAGSRPDSERPVDVLDDYRGCGDGGAEGPEEPRQAKDT